jgi:hypothetical protein
MKRIPLTKEEAEAGVIHAPLSSDEWRALHNASQVHYKNALHKNATRMHQISHYLYGKFYESDCCG